MAALSRSIPRTEPALAFEVELPWPGGRPLEAPVVAAGRLVLVGAAGAEWRLLALDAAAGVLKVERSLGPAVAVSRPAARGDALVLAVARSGRVELLRFDGDAPPTKVDLGRYPIRPSLATPVIADDGGVAVAWEETASYEPGPYEGVLLDRSGRVIKRVREWPLEVEGNVRAGEQRGDPPGSAPMLVARDAAGDVLWRREIHHQVSIVPSAGALHVIDHARRSWNAGTRDQLFAQARGLDGAAGRGTPEHLEYLRTHPLFTTTLVTRLDLATGDPLWTREVPGDVTSAIAAPHLLALVCAEESGAGSIVMISRDGEPLGRSDAQGRPYLDRWPPDRESWPRLIAADHTFLLLASGRELVCQPIAEPGRAAWRLPLPAEAIGFGPRDFTGVLAAPSIAVADGRLYVREGPRLWCFAEDSP